MAERLGYKKPENALSIHVDEEDKTTTLIQGNGSNYKTTVTIINESGLYSLILSSKMPNVKKFKRWVTSEVAECAIRNFSKNFRLFSIICPSQNLYNGGVRQITQATYVDHS